ncbi:S1C family serine protease [Subtercola frigoramans]|uniref:S1-C subfamily serine protease n=1 Tax=Subtercola frigoramans TaxID=120298 RepID=A0ABS2L5R7_9MICO|nr:trypsin-like peptidase domain-containing protein [Subtercola frigoramans]MBM7472412.1 S1-C subfamily serine protease [Subtercola frigoramans]
MHTPDSEQPESAGDATQPKANAPQPDGLIVPIQPAQQIQPEQQIQPAAAQPIQPVQQMLPIQEIQPVSGLRPADHTPQEWSQTAGGGSGAAAGSQQQYSHDHRIWRPRNFLILGAAAAAIAIAGVSVGVTMAVGVPLAIQAASSSTSTLDRPVTSDSGTSSGSTGSGSAGSGGTSSGGSGTSPGYGNGYGTGNGFGFGQGRDGSGSTSGSGTATQSATAATDAQAVGVVLIDTKLDYQNAAAAGTGIILSSDGTILTNNHVVEGSTSISVTIATTGKTYTAKVVGTDAVDDVAVLKLDGASELTTATLDTSDSVAVGDAVTGVGNAGGTGSLSAAAGAVTGLDQSVTTQAEGSAAGETLTGMIQIEADIQAGDSGGPLYDAQGEVIGIDTAASSGSATVTGFAIPINTALKIAKQIESGTESGNVTIGYPAFLGVQIGSQTSGTGSSGLGSRGSSGSTSTVAGATVAGVIDGTPAATAGLVAGDTITTVDGTTIDSGSTLTKTMKSYNPGDSVTISWTDASGATHSASVTLIEGPAA